MLWDKNKNKRIGLLWSKLDENKERLNQIISASFQKCFTFWQRAIYPSKTTRCITTTQSSWQNVLL